jgi:hypothetical protein
MEAAAQPALVGMRLDEVTHTGFFQWFHLEPAGQLDAHTTSFKPSGPDFHELVTVTARTDDAGGVVAIELAIARSFIEDPRQGMFAADIAKSFLAVALAAPDREHMQHLIDTIGYGGTYARPILTAASRARELQIERASAPYLVWLGQNPRWRRPFDTVLLRLENVVDGPAPSLRISVTANAAVAGQSP